MSQEDLPLSNVNWVSTNSSSAVNVTAANMANVASASDSDDDAPLISFVQPGNMLSTSLSSSSNLPSNRFATVMNAPSAQQESASQEEWSESESENEVPAARRCTPCGVRSHSTRPFPFGRFTDECSWSAQQRADAFDRVNPNSYGREANAAESNFASEMEVANQQNKEDEQRQLEGYSPEEQEVDYAPEGVESFDDYQRLVRIDLMLPPDLETIVLEYLDFDAIDRLDQVMVMALRLFEQVTFYHRDCLSFGEEWPTISEEAAKEKQVADEMEKRFPVGEETKNNEDDEEQSGEEDDGANSEQLFPSRVRKHRFFYHLSPHTRKILLEFSAKLAPYGVQILTNSNSHWLTEPTDAAGELPAKYLAMVKEALEDEFEAWQELHEELENSMELAEEEIRFSSNVVEMAQWIFSLPSSGIFVNAEELYEVKDVSPYNDFQEGEEPKDQSKNEKNEEGEDHANAAAHLTSFAGSVSSNGVASSRKRSREDEAQTGFPAAAATSTPAAPTAAASCSAVSTSSQPMETDADGDDEEEEEEEGLQSITQQSYQQVINEHSELRPNSAAIDRTAHVDKKLKRDFGMEVLDEESEVDSETEVVPWGNGKQRPTHAVLRDPDFFPKEKERRSLLSAEEKKAEDDHEPNSDDEEPYFYPLQSTVLRRRMTLEKFEAAWVCLDYFNKVQQLLKSRDRSEEEDRELYRGIDQLKMWTEKLRICVSHYYLLHMTRSLYYDKYLSSMNHLVQIRMEQACTDLSINKREFALLVEQITKDTSYDIKWSAEALEALQTDAESWMTDRFECTNLVMMHSRMFQVFDFSDRSYKEDRKRRAYRRSHNWDSDEGEGVDLEAHKDPAFRMRIINRDVYLTSRLSNWNP